LAPLVMLAPLVKLAPLVMLALLVDHFLLEFLKGAGSCYSIGA